MVEYGDNRMEIRTYFREPGGPRATWEAKSLFEKRKRVHVVSLPVLLSGLLNFCGRYTVFLCVHVASVFVFGSPPECGDLLGESVNEARSSNDIHVSLPLVLLVSSLDVVSQRVVSLSRPVRFCATASYALLAFTQTVLPRTATSARFP